MSAPIRGFGRLSIGTDMPTTRAQAQREASHLTVEEAPSHESSVDSSSVESEAAGPASAKGPPLGFKATGRSKITYDTRDLSPIAHSHAIAGLRAELHVEECGPSDEDFEFHLNERSRVTVSASGTTCSCTEFSAGRACKHIFVRSTLLGMAEGLLTLCSGLWMKSMRLPSLRTCHRRLGSSRTERRHCWSRCTG